MIQRGDSGQEGEEELTVSWSPITVRRDPRYHHREQEEEELTEGRGQYREGDEDETRAIQQSEERYLSKRGCHQYETSNSTRGRKNDACNTHLLRKSCNGPSISSTRRTRKEMFACRDVVKEEMGMRDVLDEEEEDAGSGDYHNEMRKSIKRGCSKSAFRVIKNNDGPTPNGGMITSDEDMINMTDTTHEYETLSNQEPEVTSALVNKRFGYREKGVRSTNNIIRSEDGFSEITKSYRGRGNAEMGVLTEPKLVPYDNDDKYRGSSHGNHVTNGERGIDNNYRGSDEGRIQLSREGTGTVDKVKQVKKRQKSNCKSNLPRPNDRTMKKGIVHNTTDADCNNIKAMNLRMDSRDEEFIPESYDYDEEVDNNDLIATEGTSSNDTSTLIETSVSTENRRNTTAMGHRTTSDENNINNSNNAPKPATEVSTNKKTSPGDKKTFTLSTPRTKSKIEPRQTKLSIIRRAIATSNTVARDTLGSETERNRLKRLTALRGKINVTGLSDTKKGVRVNTTSVPSKVIGSQRVQAKVAKSGVSMKSPLRVSETPEPIRDDESISSVVVEGYESVKPDIVLRDEVTIENQPTEDSVPEENEYERKKMEYKIIKHRVTDINTRCKMRPMKPVTPVFNKRARNPREAGLSNYGYIRKPTRDIVSGRTKDAASKGDIGTTEVDDSNRTTKLVNNRIVESATIDCSSSMNSSELSDVSADYNQEETIISAVKPVDIDVVQTILDAIYSTESSESEIEEEDEDTDDELEITVIPAKEKEEAVVVAPLYSNNRRVNACISNVNEVIRYSEQKDMNRRTSIRNQSNHYLQKSTYLPAAYKKASMPSSDELDTPEKPPLVVDSSQFSRQGQRLLNAALHRRDYLSKGDGRHDSFTPKREASSPEEEGVYYIGSSADTIAVCDKPGLYLHKLSRPTLRYDCAGLVLPPSYEDAVKRVRLMKLNEVRRADYSTPPRYEERLRVRGQTRGSRSIGVQVRIIGQELPRNGDLITEYSGDLITEYNEDLITEYNRDISVKPLRRQEMYFRRNPRIL